MGTYDFYDFLLNGEVDKEIKLRDGDIIFIPFISNKVNWEVLSKDLQFMNLSKAKPSVTP